MPYPLRSGSQQPAIPTPLPSNVDQSWARRRGIRRMTYTGSDGTEWELSDPASGVFLMKGVVGLNPGAYKEWTAEIGHHGQMFMGGRHNARDILWPIHLYHDGSDEDWLYLYDKWWDSFTYRPYSTDQYGVWAVTGPNNETRRMRVRLVDSGDDQEQDPSMRGWASFAMKLVADTPFWLGDTETMTWTTPSAGERSFFDPEAGGVINIGSEHTVDTATLTNPGDIEAWPRWTVTGPWTSIKLGVRSTLLEVPFAGAAGDVLVIDSATATATVNGVDRTGDLGTWEFESIPPGWNIPLAIELVGYGTVRCSITPHYWRAIGRRGRGRDDDV